MKRAANFLNFIIFKINILLHCKFLSYYVYFLIPYLLVLSLTHAQSHRYMGAGAAAMGNTCATTADEWAVFNNVGAMAFCEKSSVALSFDNRFSVQGLNTVSAALSIPIKIRQSQAAWGITLMRFGDLIYSEQKIGIAFGYKLQGVSLGAKMNFFQITTSGLPTRYVPTFEFGGVAQLSQVLFLGMHIYNFTQSKITEQESSRLPTVLKAGLSYRPLGDKLCVNVEVEKENEIEARFKCGLNYWLNPSFVFRTGAMSAPFVGGLGVGWRFKNMGLDYSIQKHQNLSLSHHFVWLFFFTKK